MHFLITAPQISFFYLLLNILYFHYIRSSFCTLKQKKINNKDKKSKLTNTIKTDNTRMTMVFTRESDGNF